MRDHNFATVYEAKKIQCVEGANWVVWNPLFKINNIPRTLHQITKLNYMFTENFDYYLSFNYSQQRFVIIKVEEGDENHEVAAIPETLFNCKSLGMKQAKAQVSLKAK